MCSKECVEKIENLFRECFQSVLLAAAVTAQQPKTLETDRTGVDRPSTSSTAINPPSVSEVSLISPKAIAQDPESVQASLQSFVARFLPKNVHKRKRTRRRRKPSCRLNNEKEDENEKKDIEYRKIDRYLQYILHLQSCKTTNVFIPNLSYLSSA